MFALVDAIVANDGSGHENVQPLAPYITLEVLFRVHERVVALKRSGTATGTKHKLLARAVLSLSGIPIPPDDRDVDKIGNYLDVWLTRRYIQVEKRIHKNFKGVETLAQMKAALKVKCCVVNSRGAVVEYIPPSPDVGAPPMPSVQPRGKSPHVAYTQSYLPPDVSSHELKEQLNQAQNIARSAEADLDRERERCTNAKRRLECAASEGDAAMKLLEIANSEKLWRHQDKRIKR